ncbi:uncharacterized protein FIBRA_05957 [Fibroporia radiculosa]|uniref:Uncharacterized protein n=1 Tax=Fibroporia radiculosa TaxID=599839 RepID=J4H3T6_9APHY|nr:uncharacterized protein FIBRA_05957 [Fibroporia radiculosa]CCM03809.1 predicted protein [Fibroporia radiculosa]
MSCYSTPTATDFSTFTSTDVSTSYTTTITPIDPIVTTVSSCTVFTIETEPVRSCGMVVSTVAGGTQSSVQVPVVITKTYTQSVATATQFATVCGSEPPSQPVSSDPTSSGVFGVSSSPPTLASVTNDSSASLSVYDTTIYEKSTTTLLGGSVRTTQFISTAVVTSSINSPAGVANTNNASSGTSTPKNLTGSIIGAIIGGLIAFAFLAYLFAKFFRRRKRHTLEEPEEDVKYRELVRKRHERKEDIDTDRTAAPSTAGAPRSMPRRTEGPLATQHSPQIQDTTLHTISTSHAPTLPPLPPVPAMHSDFNRPQFATRMSAQSPAHSVTGNSTSSSSSQGARSAPRPALHVANQPARESSTPPPVPSKTPSLVARTSEKRVISSPRRLSGRSLPSVPVAGPSSMPMRGPSFIRMPEPPAQTSSRFIPRDIGMSRPMSPPGPVGKAAEAAAGADKAVEAPPAYTE